MDTRGDNDADHMGVDACPEWCIAMHVATTAGWEFLKHHVPTLPLDQFDLYVTLVTDLQWDASDVARIQDEIRILFATCPRIVIELMPNCDLDVGGFFTSLHTIVTSGRPYKYIYRTHSKTQTLWMAHVNLPLIDGFETCKTLFQDPTVGMIGAATWLCTSPDMYDFGYYTAIHQWLDSLGYPSWPNQPFGFCGGAIFMARLSIFRDWLKVMGDVDCLTTRRDMIRDAFATLPGHFVEKYASWLFAIERWYGILVTRSGYTIRGLIHCDHVKHNEFATTANIYVNKPLVVGPPTRDNVASAPSHGVRVNFNVIAYLMKNHDIWSHCQRSTMESMILMATKHWLMYGRYEKRTTML